MKRGVGVFLCFMIFMSGCAGEKQAQQSQYFVLKDLSGQSVSLEDVLKQHKAVLLNFWATWCPPCQEEIPDLIRLQNQYAGKGFTVLGIDVAESTKRVSSFAAKYGINYPLVLDSDASVSESYGVVGIPTSLLLDSSGKIIGEYHSASPKLFQDVDNALK